MERGTSTGYSENAKVTERRGADGGQERCVCLPKVGGGCSSLHLASSS